MKNATETVYVNQIVDVVAQRLEKFRKRDVKAIVDEFLFELREELSVGKNVRLKDIGTIKPTVQKPRTYNNPVHKGKQVECDGTFRMKLQPSSKMRWLLKMLYKKEYASIKDTGHDA